VAAGLAAAALSLIDPLPYLQDVVRGTTRPQRGTWCIWTVLGVTAFLSQWAGGATWSQLMLGRHAARGSQTLQVWVSPGGGGCGPVDVALTSVAAVGVAGWLATSQPLVGTVCVIVADLAAFALMLPKTWRDPGSETLSTFVLAAAAGGLGAVAVGSLRPALLLYPTYYALVNGTTAAVIHLRRTTLATAEPTPIPEPAPAARG
jgi:hypothetical protein